MIGGRKEEEDVEEVDVGWLIPEMWDFAIWVGGTGGQGSGWWNRVCIRERMLQTRAADPTPATRKTRKQHS